MCTLTYIPLPGEQIITSNRDEHESRGDSSFPMSLNKNGVTITFPQDPLAGGTWLAANDIGTTTVLLNGAFEKHKHRPPYRLSRGIMLLDSFLFSGLETFSKKYDLTDIEPFTMIQFQLSANIITEIRWDGTNSFVKGYDFNTPHIWSSSTLYSLEVRTERDLWFKQWIKAKRSDSESMLKFHQFGGNGSTQNTITMDRGNGLKTVSISQLVHQPTQFSFRHNNLISGTSRIINL